jgi:hypothetical protein
MMNKLNDASEEVAKAWELRATAREYIIPRILWLRLYLALRESSGEQVSLVTVLVGQLKSALQSKRAFEEWDMDPVLSHLQSNLLASDYEFLAALVAALNDSVNLSSLDDFEQWCYQVQIPLDNPWPT